MSLPTAGLLILFSVEAGAAPAAAPIPVSAPVPAPAPAPAPAATLADTLARLDVLHRRRDEPPVVAEEHHLVDAAVARTGHEYGVLWRAARLYFWLSDDPSLPAEQRSALGKSGWDLAERAITANPNQVEGYYWAALNMGNYALGLGVVKALTMGMEAKFKDRLGRAASLAPAYQYGGIDVAWGRFYEKLPWPKRDRKQAEAHLRRALPQAPGGNLRARVYLADTLAHDNRAPEAKRLLDDVVAAVPGRYDPPEERRARALATGMVASVVKLMN